MFQYCKLQIADVYLKTKHVKVHKLGGKMPTDAPWKAAPLKLPQTKML
jgi:hypothetical protein